MRLDAVNLKKGDTLIVTVRSDEIDKDILKGLKRQMKKAFPKNKIAIFGVAREDEISISVLNQGEK